MRAAAETDSEVIVAAGHELRYTNGACVGAWELCNIKMLFFAQHKKVG